MFFLFFLQIGAGRTDNTGQPPPHQTTARELKNKINQKPRKPQNQSLQSYLSFQK